VSCRICCGPQDSRLHHKFPYATTVVWKAVVLASPRKWRGETLLGEPLPLLLVGQSYIIEGHAMMVPMVILLVPPLSLLPRSGCLSSRRVSTTRWDLTPCGIFEAFLSATVPVGESTSIGVFKRPPLECQHLVVEGTHVLFMVFMLISDSGIH